MKEMNLKKWKQQEKECVKKKKKKITFRSLQAEKKRGTGNWE